MLRIGLVAGEISGDVLGGGLVREIRRRHPDAVFEGVGGAEMRAAGMTCWYDAEALAVMGLTEVIGELPRLLRLRRDLARRWRAQPPDVFVGIDAPDFNLGLEKKLRRRSIPTVHYVSPSVWAWREGRVRKIAKACDRVLCLLPFEPEFYRRHGIAADFVGHPLAQRIEHDGDRGAARAALGLAPDQPVLAVLPGSRAGEIARLGSDFVAAARLLRDDDPQLQVVAPLASERGREQFRALVEAAGLTDTVRLTVGNAGTCMQAADVLLMASGTATLEGLLHGRPMVVAYRVATSTYRIVRALGLIKVDRFSLPNLLTPEPLVTELIQDDVTPQRLADAVASLLQDPQRTARMQTAFRAVHEQLAQDADVLAADAVLQVAT